VGIALPAHGFFSGRLTGKTATAGVDRSQSNSKQICHHVKATGFNHEQAGLGYA
jgi:hypothetical protein